MSVQTVILVIILIAPRDFAVSVPILTEGRMLTVLVVTVTQDTRSLTVSVRSPQTIALIPTVRRTPMVPVLRPVSLDTLSTIPICVSQLTPPHRNHLVSTGA